MKFTSFEWDRGNQDKCQKHGVSLAEIEHVFRNDPLVLPDKTGTVETRFNAVGVNSNARHIFVVFTIRTVQKSRFIRPLSARYMHEKEIRTYEKAQRP